jgi:predicted PurR-regulated permease PerM
VVLAALLGITAFGLVGLFIGAVVLAVGYVLFGEWVGEPAPGTESAGVAPEGGTLRAAE